MAEASVSVDQDHFSCPICLDLLKSPVTIPCGHSYCMSCISVYWDQDDQKGVYSCPQCRQTFTPRPALGKNTILAEMVEKLKKTKAAVPDPYCESGDVESDAFIERKSKAFKSCPEQHNNFNNERQNFMDTTGRLQKMICSQHGRLLEVFCRTDQQCICARCMIEEHKNHDTEEQSTETERHLQNTQRKFKQRILEREKKIQELRRTVESHKLSAQAAVEDNDRIFTDLIRSIERRRSEVTQLIRAREQAAVSRDEELLEQLEQEITDLMRRDAELEQLLHTDSHIQYLQPLSAPSKSTDRMTVSSPLCFKDIRQSVCQLRRNLEDKIRNISVINTAPRIRNEFLQYSHQFTLDPNTVNKHLRLSEGNRVATYTGADQQYPDHPDRFDVLYQVLCRECVSGCSYWEVKWTGGVGISVSYKSISKKGRGVACVFGCNNQSWRLFCSDSSYSFSHNNVETKLPVPSSCSRIGVYVDLSAGTLSFYSVSDTLTLIHRVQTTFTQPLYPGFNVHHGSRVKLCDLTG